MRNPVRGQNQQQQNQRRQPLHHQPNSRAYHRNRNLVNSTSSSIYRRGQHDLSQHRCQDRTASCSPSICYSYLIASFSSFLVVLGIYLSITRFNGRFLYISLAGLMIEAVSACLYCISNIHKSKSAQYKQTTTNSLNLEAAAAANGRSPPPTRQIQARQVTHILTNRPLNQTIPVSTGDNNTDSLVNQTTPEQDNDHPAPNDNLSNRVDRDSEEDNSNNLITTDSTDETPPQGIDGIVQHMSVITANVQLPSTNQVTCHNLPEPSSILATSQPHQLQEQQHHDSTNDGSQSRLDQDVEPTATRAESETLAQTSHIIAIQSNNIPDLIIERTSPTDNVVLPAHGNGCTEAYSTKQGKTPLNRNSRPTRRTLVMGLSGEEEVIEIDEEDLDNMSILPPSYESIATDRNADHQRN